MWKSPALHAHNDHVEERLIPDDKGGKTNHDKNNDNADSVEWPDWDKPNSPWLKMTKQTKVTDF